MRLVLAAGFDTVASELRQQCVVAMQLARHIFSAKRRETYVLAASVVRFRGDHPLLLLPFPARATLAGLYDWKVMGDRPRAISRRKPRIEMTITPS